MKNFLPTSITSLDNILGGGLISNNLYFITGRPATGKTSLVTQIAYNTANYLQSIGSNKTVVMFSLEGAKSNIANEIRQLPLNIFDEPQDINNIISLTKTKLTPALIIIDYIYILKNWNWDNFHKFKKLATELNIPIIVVAQLSSKFEKIPTLDITHIEMYEEVKKYSDKIILLKKDDNKLGKFPINIDIYSKDNTKYKAISLYFDGIHKLFYV